jgi:outer membrane protein assembly factor BamB
MNNRMTGQRVFSVLGLMVAAFSASMTDVQSADWRQFRGTATNSVAVGESLPTELSRETINWEVELPGRGLSGPIIVDGQVVITASSGYSDDRLHIISMDASTGQQQWARQFAATGRTSAHPKMCMATPTPASDGKRIFAMYSSNDFICTDMNGNLQWYRGLGEEFPNASNSLGMSSSPIVMGNTVIAQVESDAEAFVIGVDVVSGETKWRLDRQRKSNWTSPTVLPTDGNRPALVLLQSFAGITAVNPEIGAELWTYGDGASTVPSATVSDGQIIVPSNGLTILQPSLDGASYEMVRNVKNAKPATASPIVLGGMMFSLNGSGVLSAASVHTGNRLWQLRLHGRFSSTPVVANGHLYCFSEKGMATVVRPTEDDGAIVSQLDMTETILCSPAVANDALYVRSDGHLWKLSGQN